MVDERIDERTDEQMTDEGIMSETKNGEPNNNVPRTIETRREILRRRGLPFFEQPSASPVAVVTSPKAVQFNDWLPSGSPLLALIATRSHLPYAEFAARSFLVYHQDFRAFLLLVDGSEADRTLVPGVTVILLSDLGLPDSGWLAAKLDATEFSNALKPALLMYLANYGSKAIYMDCDIGVFARFDAMIAALETANIVLIPHMMALFPKPEEQWRHPNNADIFNSGLINAGCFGINLDNSKEFLEFWHDANILHAWSPDEGRQTDQQFLNWALINCDNVHVLRDKSYNVAYWNLHERSLRCNNPDSLELNFEVEGHPLTFFHFSGFDPNDTLTLSRHDQRYSVYTLPSIALILEWYGSNLLAGPLAGLVHEPSRFDTLANGIRLNVFLRNILKRYDSYFPRFDTTTEAGADALCNFLMSPLPATGSRLPLVASVIYQARPDLQTGYAGAHTDLNPVGFIRWFYHHAGSEYGIESLISRFRHTLESDSLAGFTSATEKLLPESAKGLRFLGAERRLAAAEFRIMGRPDLATVLLSGENEWFFFSDFSAILTLYAGRTDLQKIFPDLFGRSHQDFTKWLKEHGTAEHGLPVSVVNVFANKAEAKVLARLFSILSRREDLGAIAVEELLSDKPERLLRALIRESGEGLEYDLSDVEVILYLHQHNRAVLVPLYLELPAIRRRTLSSRTPEGRRALLPVPVDQDWVLDGCRMHAANFSPADVALEQEIKQLRSRMLKTGQDVISVLNASRLDVSAEQLTRIAEKRAIRTMHAADSAFPGMVAQTNQTSGINLFGYFLANTGVGESSRGLARALSHITEVRRIPQFTGHLERSARIEQLFTHYDHHAKCNVFVSYPHASEDLLGLLPPEFTERRRNIIHLAWEQRDWNTHWRSIYGRYDEIWAISDFAAQPFREMFGSAKVRVVPNVLLVDDFPATSEAAAQRFTRPVFRFLFVFDANSSMERKNPEAVLAAFTAAFAGSALASQVELVLKVNNLNRPEHAGRVAKLRRAAAASGLSVTFDGRTLSRNEVLLLIASADCYVSLHRAEGFGYTMAEAMYLGVPVIASGYSGNLEYMTPDNSYLVPCTEQLVQLADGPFQRGSIWGDPDVGAAAEMMRRVVENRAEAREVGERGAASVRRQLLPEVVAEGLSSALGKAAAASSLKVAG
jgi:glycosyltransferase involved in cell wall biosynthesis